MNIFYPSFMPNNIIPLFAWARLTNLELFILFQKYSSYQRVVIDTLSKAGEDDYTKDLEVQLEFTKLHIETLESLIDTRKDFRYNLSK